MTLKQLGIEKNESGADSGIPGALVGANCARPEGGGPPGMNGGRKGMGVVRVGGSGQSSMAWCFPHPFDPDAPAISKDKPLLVGYNRDETVFFFNQQRNTEVFNLTEAALKERLGKEFEGNADAIFETYHKSRPDASPSDLYIAITTARMIAIGAMTIAERKSAQRGAPAFMYVFKHENPALIPGTQHKMGTPHHGDHASSQCAATSPQSTNGDSRVEMAVDVDFAAGMVGRASMAERGARSRKPGSRQLRVSGMAGVHGTDARHHGDRCRLQSRERSVSARA